MLALYCGCSVTKSCLTLCDLMHWAYSTVLICPPQAHLSSTISQSVLKFMSTETVMLSNHFILCHSLFFLSQTFPSIRIFSNESGLPIRWPKYWRFSFSNSPSNEYSGLISFRIDWFDPLTVQGTLKRLVQHHNLKVCSLALSLLYCQILKSKQDYWKNYSFDYTDFCQQSNLSAFYYYYYFNMLSRFVIAFLPRNKLLLISWLQSLSTVVLESKKRKSVTASTFSPSICHEMMGLDAMILVF